MFTPQMLSFQSLIPKAPLAGMELIQPHSGPSVYIAYVQFKRNPQLLLQEILAKISAIIATGVKMTIHGISSAVGDRYQISKWSFGVSSTRLEVKRQAHFGGVTS